MNDIKHGEKIILTNLITGEVLRIDAGGGDVVSGENQAEFELRKTVEILAVSVKKAIKKFTK